LAEEVPKVMFRAQVTPETSFGLIRGVSKRRAVIAGYPRPYLIVLELLYGFAWSVGRNE